MARSYLPAVSKGGSMRFKRKTEPDADARGSDELSATDRFIEQMGLMFEEDGQPRIAGRVFALLLVEDGALSLSEIARRLKVSRASVSTNARLLLRVGVIERVGIPGDRQDHYRLIPAPYDRLLSGMEARIQRASAFFSESAASFPPERATACARLLGIASFYREAGEALASMIRRLTAARTSNTKRTSS